MKALYAMNAGFGSKVLTMIPIKKQLVLAALVLGCIAWAAVSLSRNLNSDAEWEREQLHFICRYPPYLQVRAGMDRRSVEQVLGVPTERAVLRKPEVNAFGQGSMGWRIREEWTYRVRGWNGHIEIYFDARGRVIGTNCGNG